MGEGRDDDWRELDPQWEESPSSRAGESWEGQWMLLAAIAAKPQNWRNEVFPVDPQMWFLVFVKFRQSKSCWTKKKKALPSQRVQGPFFPNYFMFSTEEKWFFFFPLEDRLSLLDNFMLCKNLAVAAESKVCFREAVGQGRSLPMWNAWLSEGQLWALPVVFN